MQKFLAVFGLSPFVKNKLKSLFPSPDLSKAPNYDTWRHRFINQRLALGLWVAIISYSTFILSQLNNLLFDPENFRLSWLITQVVVEFSLLTVLAFLRTSFGTQHPRIIFLLFSLSVTLSPQIRATINGVSQPAIIEWPLMFFAQATLVPVQWPLHLWSQVGTFLYYIIARLIFQLPVQLPARWMTPDFLLLYLFWICLISNLSVYLYDRLARAKFNSHHALEEAYVQLQIEQERSESLLLNILPYPIAQRLKENQETIADSFTNAGVLFGDIVGFTELSGQIPPTDLVLLLNKIFSRFDHLADRHGLEKIKTIGDAYMVVSGLPFPRDDYAEAIADMALDMQKTLQEFNAETGENFEMRIGIATGPVIAGVIGLKKFIYDLWGDTVNIASRMESHGIANEIQVTDMTYECLKGRYLFEQRGTIFIKGKGTMTTYLLKKKQEDIISSCGI